MLLKILSSLRINIQQSYGAMLHEWRLFIKFLRTRQLLLWAVLLVVVISYSVKIFNYDYSIDTGRALYDYNGILMSWEGIHRYSLVFLKEVLFPLGLNIYLANILTMLTLVLVTVTILYMCARITNRLVLKRENIWLEITFAAIFITSPIVLEQLNFTLQNFEVALGTLFATLAPAFVWFGYVRKNLLSIIVGSLLYAFCIAIYQSFAPYIMMISVFFVFMVLLGYGVGRPYRLLGVLVLSFILSFIIYVSASYVLYSAGITEASVFSEATGGGDSYLRRQIVWSDSVYDALINIKDYIWNISTGVGIFYTSLPLICVVIILYKLLTRNERKSIILQQVLLLGALCLTAVVLAIVLGQGEEIRARYPVQPVLAALLLYIAYTLVVSRRAKIVLLLIAVPFIFSQLKSTNLLMAVEHNKFVTEAAMAQDLIARINKQGVEGQYSQHKLIVIGDWKYEQAVSIREKGMMIGVSHFEGGSTRVTELFNAMGYKFGTYYENKKNTDEHKKECLGNQPLIEVMKPYPSNESIKVVANNFVIIKLSEVPDIKRNCSL